MPMPVAMPRLLLYIAITIAVTVTTTTTNLNKHAMLSEETFHSTQPKSAPRKKQPIDTKIIFINLAPASGFVMRGWEVKQMASCMTRSRLVMPPFTPWGRVDNTSSRTDQEDGSVRSGWFWAETCWTRGSVLLVQRKQSKTSRNHLLRGLNLIVMMVFFSFSSCRSGLHHATTHFKIS